MNTANNNADQDLITQIQNVLMGVNIFSFIIEMKYI